MTKWRKKTAQWGDSFEQAVDQEFLNSIENDLDTPRALQRVREVEKSNDLSDADKRAMFIYADRVLALDLMRVNSRENISKEQQDLLDARHTARLEKNWGESDKLRIELEATGLEIKDSAIGQEWSWR